MLLSVETGGPKGPPVFGCVICIGKIVLFSANRRAGDDAAAPVTRAAGASGRRQGLPALTTWRIAPAGETRFRDSAPVGEDRHRANAPRGQGGRSPLRFSPAFAAQKRENNVSDWAVRPVWILGKRFSFNPISFPRKRNGVEPQRKGARWPGFRFSFRRSVLKAGSSSRRDAPSGQKPEAAAADEMRLQLV